MTDSKIEAQACEEGASYYQCPVGNFTGCCSHDPCEQGICYDQAQALEDMNEMEKRDVITTTITKILARDSGSESNITTTKTCTVTITSTVYNTLTITSSSNSTSLSTPSMANLVALKSVARIVPSIIKPSSASMGQQTTKTSTHTSSAITTTKALIPVSNNGTVTPKKADAQNPGRVAGITLGSLAGALMIGLLIFLCCRRRRRLKETNNDTDSTLKVPDTPAIESGGKRKFVFESKSENNDDKDKAMNQRNHEQSDKTSNGSFLARTASRLGQIHPALRSDSSSLPNTASKPNYDNNTGSHLNTNASFAAEPYRFYSSNNRTHDLASGNRMTPDLPPINVIRSCTKKSKEINKTRPSPSSPRYQYTYDPQTLIVPARNNSDNKSINSSISPTPTSMIGPISSSPVEPTNKSRNRDIGRALTTPVPTHTNTDQESPDYILPSQRPGRNTTPSIWTDATIPYTPAFDLLFPSNPLPKTNMLQSYTAYRPSSPNTSTITSPDSNTNLTSNFPPSPLKATMKSKPVMQISTSTANQSSGTTTESDIMSPRHQLQEPTRRRKSLFQSPGGINDDDLEARRKDWI